MKNKHEFITKQLKKEYRLHQKIAIDILGALLIIASGLVGWLPGPGGLPLLIGGLSLLAKNHHWAHNLLEQLKINGNKAIKLIFRNNPTLFIIYDIIAFIIAITAIIFLIKLENYKFLWPIAFMFGISVALFLGNRGRYDALESKFKKTYKSFKKNRANKT